MPIYEYRCEPCRHRFEAFLASSAEQAVCPKCASTQLSRLMSTFAASVPGGYKATQAAAPAPSADSAPKAGGCGGGCACH
jgi:putative FmdB family regulatory protein